MDDDPSFIGLVFYGDKKTVLWNWDHHDVMKYKSNGIRKIKKNSAWERGIFMGKEINNAWENPIKCNQMTQGGYLRAYHSHPHCGGSPCFLEIFQAGPSSDRSTSICLSLVALPRVIWPTQTDVTFNRQSTIQERQPAGQEQSGCGASLRDTFTLC